MGRGVVFCLEHVQENIQKITSGSSWQLQKRLSPKGVLTLRYEATNKAIIFFLTVLMEYNLQETITIRALDN